MYSYRAQYMLTLYYSPSYGIDQSDCAQLLRSSLGLRDKVEPHDVAV